MCIFCQIVSGDSPSHKVYEDDKVLAILDIYPAAHGHVLVLSKKHYANLEETPEDELAHFMVVIKKLGLMMKEKFGATGYNVCMNNDPVAGQQIPHLHFHIVPREEGDGLTSWPQNGYESGEAEKILKKLKGE